MENILRFVLAPNRILMNATHVEYNIHEPWRQMILGFKGAGTPAIRSPNWISHSGVPSDLV